jgi:hypothetical protein
MARILFLLFLSSSFATEAQVFNDYDTNADFKKYKTFAWIAPGDSVLNRYRSEKLYGGRIVYSAEQELRAKGMRPDSVRPDAIFVYYTSSKDEVRYTEGATLSVGVAVRGPGYYAGGMAPVAGGKITAHVYEAGTLAFEMYDSQTGDLLWKGGDKKDFKMTDDIEAIIQKAVKKIFKKFPVKHKK